MKLIYKDESHLKTAYILVCTIANDNWQMNVD